MTQAVCRRGRVLERARADQHGRGRERRASIQCATRRLLKTLATDQRHVVAAGDRVLFRPVENTDPKEGVIERVEPRHGCICRAVRGRQQVLVANVDQLAIVASAAEPRLKPQSDRPDAGRRRERGRSAADLHQQGRSGRPGRVCNRWWACTAQMGYEVLLLSAKTGFGVERLHRALAGRANVVVGQSGVGKSSLLNAIDPSFHLHVQPVSEDNEKGKHTTTTARLLPLGRRRLRVDTPGMRQFQLWDVTAEEVAGFFRDLRPYVNLCRFPDCTHTHEDDCAVKDAVADGRLDERRYESYCHLFAGDFE